MDVLLYKCRLCGEIIPKPLEKEIRGKPRPDLLEWHLVNQSSRPKTHMCGGGKTSGVLDLAGLGSFPTRTNDQCVEKAGGE
jgi:hypothetical protein